MSREEQVEAAMAEHEYVIGLKRGSICTCGHVPTVEPESLRTQQDYHRTHLAQAILNSPAFRAILADAWDEGWDKYDNYAGGTGVPEPPRENPYRADGSGT